MKGLKGKKLAQAVEYMMYGPVGNSRLKEKQMAKGSALSKELNCSDEFRKFTGKKKISRGKAMKVVWDYIKKHKLQSEDDGRIVECDKKLQPLFKKVIKEKRKLKVRGNTIRVPAGSIFMTEIGGALSKHLDTE